MNNTLETREFQAEARQLLNLMVHSIYSNKDIFLRELISNSSDALDKLRVDSLVNQYDDIDTKDLHLELKADTKARTLAVIDNGIGMSKDEVVSLIGTIAKSGTAEYLRLLKENKEQPAAAELIGQFGVGFYSCFMVADKVTLQTRRAGETGGTRWESTGDGKYTIETLDSAPQGTTVTLHLKAADPEDGLHDYSEEWKLRDIVKQYSDFIAYPIRMEVERSEVERDAEGKAKEGGETKVTRTTETLNSMKAIWARPRSEVKEDEYKEFYKHVSHDWNDPLRTIHLKAEGTFEYQALLFVPSKAPMDLYMRDGKRGVQLYVKRVFIMDNCEELVPEYLRFVKGVVDAADLSLNVSREILQKDRHIQMMRKRLVKKVLDDLQELREKDSKAYDGFWKEFGRPLKEGIYHDFDNRDALLELSLFESTASPTEKTTLKAYIERMKEGQESIYYLTGEHREAIENSPHLEAFKAKGYEVLLLTDPIDDIWITSVHEYKEKKFQSAAQGAAELGSAEEKQKDEEELKEQTRTFATLLAWMQTRLMEHVKEVRLSHRLTTSPACLVGDTHDLSPSLEKLMRAMGQDAPKAKRILELNPQHALVTGLQKAYEEKKNDAVLCDAVELLYGLAILAEGGELADPARFSRLLSDMLVRAI